MKSSYYTMLLVPTPLPRRCIPNSVLFPACLVSNRRLASLLLPRFACPRFTWSLHLEKPSSTNSLNPLRVELYCLYSGFILGSKPGLPILSFQRPIHPSIMDSSTQQASRSLLALFRVSTVQGEWFFLSGLLHLYLIRYI